MRLIKNKSYRNTRSFVFSSIVVFVFSLIVLFDFKSTGSHFGVFVAYIALLLGYFYELWQYKIIKHNREVVRETTEIRRSLFIDELPFDTNLEEYFFQQRKNLETLKKEGKFDDETLKVMYSLEKLWGID